MFLAKAIHSDPSLEQKISWRRNLYTFPPNKCNQRSGDREILHRQLSRKRDESRRGLSVDFKEETDILRNGHSRNEGQKTRAERPDL